MPTLASNAAVASDPPSFFALPSTSRPLSLALSIKCYRFATDFGSNSNYVNNPEILVTFRLQWLTFKGAAFWRGDVRRIRLSADVGGQRARADNVCPSSTQRHQQTPVGGSLALVTIVIRRPDTKNWGGFRVTPEQITGCCGARVLAADFAARPSVDLQARRGQARLPSPEPHLADGRCRQ